MKCPECGKKIYKIIKELSNPHDLISIYECNNCSYEITTKEISKRRREIFVKLARVIGYNSKAITGYGDYQPHLSFFDSKFNSDFEIILPSITSEDPEEAVRKTIDTLKNYKYEVVNIINEMVKDIEDSFPEL